MALKIDTIGVNQLPHVERVDANPVEGGYEIIFVSRIEGQSTPIVAKLTNNQASDLSRLLTIRRGA